MFICKNLAICKKLEIVNFWELSEFGNNIKISQMEGNREAKNLRGEEGNFEVIARLKICGGINILTLTFNIKIIYYLVMIV